MGFKVPQLDSSCCGCTLRTGSLIILWIYVIFGLLTVTAPLITPQGGTNSTKVDPAVTTSTTLSPIDEGEWQKKVAPFGVGSVIIGAVIVIIGSVGLYGVYRELHSYLVPYLVWVMVNVLITMVADLYKSFTLSDIIGQFIYFLVFFYFWLVVFSHYRVLKGSVRPSIQA